MSPKTNQQYDFLILQTRATDMPQYIIFIIICLKDVGLMLRCARKITSITTFSVGIRGYYRNSGCSVYYSRHLLVLSNYLDGCRLKNK